MNIAIVGATGCVGQTILKILEQKRYHPESLFLIASNKITERTISYRGADLPVHDLASFDFSLCDVALSAAGAEVSREYVPRATAMGCLVIDKTSCFRMEDDVPLVIPEINSRDVRLAKRRIISSPNCSTTPLALSLFPLLTLGDIDHVVVSTYQSVSGLGQKGLKALDDEIQGNSSNPAFFKPIAYNVIPHIDHFFDDGSTKEEWKMKVELNKILKTNIQTSVTCVRVPVRVGHSMSVFVQFSNPIKLSEVYQAWARQAGLKVLDDPKTHMYTTPKEHAGDDLIYVSRLRQESPTRLVFWAMGDNLRKGAALNAIQILETLQDQDMISKKEAA